MKWLLVFAAMPIWAQFGNVDESVAHLMTSGMLTGSEMKALSRTGDAAAAALTRHIANLSLDSAGMDRVLWIVHGSFESLPWVERVADREPTATLSLLAYLEEQTHDDALQKKIVDERAFVLDQVAKLKVGMTCVIANHAAAKNGRASRVYRLLTEPERNNASAWPRPGDEAAGVLTRVIGTCTLDTNDVRRVLSVIHWSFDAGGTTAGQTMALLRNLEAAGDGAEIDATRRYVLAQIH